MPVPGPGRHDTWNPALPVAWACIRGELSAGAISEVLVPLWGGGRHWIPLQGCPRASVMGPYAVLPLQTLSFQRGFSSHETPGPLVWPCPAERRLKSRLNCVPNSSTARKPSRGKCNVCRPGQAHGHFIKMDSWENINQQFTL